MHRLQHPGGRRPTAARRLERIKSMSTGSITEIKDIRLSRWDGRKQVWVQTLPTMKIPKKISVFRRLPYWILAARLQLMILWKDVCSPWTGKPVWRSTTSSSATKDSWQLDYPLPMPTFGVIPGTVQATSGADSEGGEKCSSRESGS